MAEPLAEAERAEKTYGSGAASSLAVASATCRVLPGARIALVGPSGSGKTTLLYLLGGLERPTKGSVTWPVLGPVGRLAPDFVGFVFQNPNLLPPLTAAENVALPLLLVGTSAERARRRALALLELIQLGGIADRLPDDLSGGQAQRVAVARGLAACPTLVLADEPTGQLDRATATSIIEHILTAVAGSGAALVVATHDDRVASLFDSRWTMSHGTLNTAP